MNCADCRHWSRDASLERDASGARVKSRWGRCELAAGLDGGPACSASLAFASDCSAYAASFNTHEDFSCSQAAGPLVVLDRDPGDES